MADNTAPDQVVASPTYMADIRFFFRPEDVDHMGAKGIDLGTYDGVERNALAIFAHTAPRTPRCLRIQPGNGALSARRLSRTGSPMGIRWERRLRRARGPRVPRPTACGTTS